MAEACRSAPGPWEAMFLILATGLKRLKSGISFSKLKPNLVTNRWTPNVAEHGKSADDGQRHERALEQRAGDAGKRSHAQVGVKRLGQGGRSIAFMRAHPAREPGDDDDDEHDELGGGHQLARSGKLAFVAGLLEPPPVGFFCLACESSAMTWISALSQEQLATNCMIGSRRLREDLRKHQHQPASSVRDSSILMGNASVHQLELRIEAGEQAPAKFPPSAATPAAAAPGAGRW